jgi:S1-C subfamily serine protease
MRRKWFAIIFFVLIAWSVSAYADQTAEEILKAVVKIRSVIPKEAHTANTLGTEREGSGVVIDSEGLVLTIGYLIVEAETIEVTGIEGKPVSAKFIGYDHNTGFGLLRTDKPLDVVPIKLGRSSTVKVGDPVLIAGHGGTDSAIAGRVISRKEFAGYWEYLLDEAIYTAPAYTNFGGAALINPEGQLLGIGSLFSQFTISGLGSIPCNIFAPIDLLHPILSDLKTAGRARKAPRPWLGINAEEAHGRIFITKVTSGGPAEEAGLKPGDLILSVKGKTVDGLADFYRKIWEVGNAGVDIPLGLLRGIQIREITIRSADRHQFLLLKPKKI